MILLYVCVMKIFDLTAMTLNHQRVSRRAAAAGSTGSATKENPPKPNGYSQFKGLKILCGMNEYSSLVQKSRLPQLLSPQKRPLVSSHNHQQHHQQHQHQHQTTLNNQPSFKQNHLHHNTITNTNNNNYNNDDRTLNTIIRNSVDGGNGAATIGTTKIPSLPTATNASPVRQTQNGRTAKCVHQSDECRQPQHFLNSNTTDDVRSYTNIYTTHNGDLLNQLNANTGVGIQRTTAAAAASKYFDNSIRSEQLSEEHLRSNVEIVLNNINRNYHILQSYLMQESGAAVQNNKQTLINELKLSAAVAAAGILNMTSPEVADCNSNPHVGVTGLTTGIGGGGGGSGGGANSVASSQDFSHDNSDYQWFLDYGYRDGVAHQSILSSLSASYNGIGELSYYEDMAKNIDANLAEVDMESFRAEDIHSLLTALPMSLGCGTDNQQRRSSNNRSTSSGRLRTANANDLDNSICKSELLFSPVKEMQHISVDSLDLDGFPDEADIILTCKANKDNYTIAFEGSALYSDESYCDSVGPDAQTPFHVAALTKAGKMNVKNMPTLDEIGNKKEFAVSMTKSEMGLTTWSKLKKNSSTQLQRYPSGNNNVSVKLITRHMPNCCIRKSTSMPNLQLKTTNPINVSQTISNSTINSFGKGHGMLPMCQMPISTTSGTESPVPLQNSNNSANIGQQPSFNLVKLFIKQKSSSTDTCMDVSSGCWPSDESSSGGELKMRKKSMNDSGKCSALSRHDEEEDCNSNDQNDEEEHSFQYDSLDVTTTVEHATIPNDDVTAKKTSNHLYREVFDSPTNRKKYKYCHLNIKNHYEIDGGGGNGKNPTIYNLNNNNSIERTDTATANALAAKHLNETNHSLSDFSRTSDNVTQVYQKSAKIPLDVITRSMQTSILPQDRCQVVPPSFLAQLNKHGEKDRAAPVYVIYPNYSLPDLGFIQSSQPADVLLSPISFKESVGKRRPPPPTSLTVHPDYQALAQTERYNHIVDWQSLVTLLPHDYRKMLSHIPEASAAEATANLSQRPFFCMTPPLRRSRSTSCDCVSYVSSQACTTSSSSSGQPPSSGYRGSSTLLTDSELDGTSENGNSRARNNMYVYQYESTMQDETSLAERPPSGRVVRGILRRGPAGNKRNSMCDEYAPATATAATVSGVCDKRRSLQDPYYAHSNAFKIPEDHMAEMESVATEAVAEQQKLATLLSPNIGCAGVHDPYAAKLSKTNANLITEVGGVGGGQDVGARIRAEHFLSHVPKSELKYYAEIANILESIESIRAEPYDRAKLRSEVSRALAVQKHNQQQHPHRYNGSSIVPPPPPSPPNLCDTNRLRVGNTANILPFGTPPNSPNISFAAASRAEKRLQQVSEREKQDKIQSNRFKRLQIQWELLSKESMIREAAAAAAQQAEVKSGGNTPTSAQKSRIPRPVSYPSTKTHVELPTKALRSPSRLATPKKYTPTAVTDLPMAPPRTAPSKLQTTPKRTIPGVR